MDEVTADQGMCSCQASMFSGNADHVNFFLPKLGMACNCSNKQASDNDLVEGSESTDLVNILRPWQVDFLASQNLHTALEFVHTFNQTRSTMERKMRLWRKEQGLPSVKTKSCGIALHIWARTCKSVVRSVRKQRAQGVKPTNRPEFLQLTQDDRTVSTLGCGSIRFDEATQQEM